MEWTSEILVEVERQAESLINANSVIQGSGVTYRQARALGHPLRQRLLDGQLTRAHRAWPAARVEPQPGLLHNGEVLTTGVRVHSHVALDYLIGAIEQPARST